jgi:hypothetical protein
MTCNGGERIPVMYQHVINGDMSTLTAKFDDGQETAKPSTNAKMSLGVGYVGKNTSPAGKSPEECVASAFGEVDKKFTNSVPPIRWRFLHKLLRHLNNGLDKVSAGEVVIVMTSTGAATWNEAMTIDHPGFVTMAYLNFAEVSTSAEEHRKSVKKMKAVGAANDFNGFVYVILLSKRILELLVKMDRWPKSHNTDVNSALKMPKYATWPEYAKKLRHYT